MVLLNGLGGSGAGGDAGMDGTVVVAANETPTGPNGVWSGCTASSGCGCNGCISCGCCISDGSSAM